MKFQFYFFGFAYFLKSTAFGVELYFWTDTDKWFYVLLCNALLIIFVDIIPIIYITVVHNDTFKEMEYS